MQQAGRAGKIFSFKADDARPQLEPAAVLDHQDS